MAPAYEGNMEIVTAEDLFSDLVVTAEGLRHANNIQRLELRELLRGFTRQHFQPFRFLDLPPELRNRIYELALTVDCDLQLPGPRQCQLPNLPLAVQPPLTMVSQAIRSEALSIFYQCNDFSIHVHRCGFSHFLNYFNGLSEQTAKLIPRITIDIRDHGFSSKLGCTEGLLDLVCWWAKSTASPELRWTTPYSNNSVFHKVFDFANEITSELTNQDSKAIDIHAYSLFFRWMIEHSLQCKCKKHNPHIRCCSLIVPNITCSDRRREQIVILDSDDEDDEST